MQKRDAGKPDEDFAEGRYLNLEKRLREGGARPRPKRRGALERGIEDENDEETRLQRELRRKTYHPSLAKKPHARDPSNRAARGLADAEGMPDAETDDSGQLSVGVFGRRVFPGGDHLSKRGGRGAGLSALNALGEHSDDLWWPSSGKSHPTLF